MKFDLLKHLRKRTSALENKKRTSLTSRQQTIVKELFTAFSERDYPECVTKVFELGMTLGLRYFTPILSEGINFEIEREPNLQVALIYTIAHLRLGDQTGAEGAFMMNVAIGGEIREWLTTLLALSLRRTTFEATLETPQTDEQCLQAHYYEAEGRVTDRNFSAALEMFQKCLELPGECPERDFARARVSWLKEGDLP